MAFKPLYRIIYIKKPDLFLVARVLEVKNQLFKSTLLVYIIVSYGKAYY